MALPEDLAPGQLSDSNVVYLFHHVFLPPKLPNEDDSSPGNDDSLVGVVQGCLASFAETTTGTERDMILDARNTIANLRQLQDHYGHLREDVLGEALRDIKSPGTQRRINHH